MTDSPREEPRPDRLPEAGEIRLTTQQWQYLAILVKGRLDDLGMGRSPSITTIGTILQLANEVSKSDRFRTFCEHNPL